MHILLLSVSLVILTSDDITKRISANEYAIKAKSKTYVIDFCEHTGCNFVRQVTSEYFLIKCLSSRQRSKSGSSRDDVIIQDMAVKFKDTINNIEFQKLHKDYPRTVDSKWTEMWNLNNQVLPSMRVQDAWSLGLSGSGVTVAVVDDGLQLNHPDLRNNINATKSYDYYNYDSNPTPTSINDGHGTKVAGLVAAVANNNRCIVGVAHKSTIIGIKILGDEGVTDVTKALALNHHLADVDIYTNSWGPRDGYGYVGPGSVTKSALYDGVTKGRGTKGVIYVWAAGNGGLDDNCNGDAYVNSIYTIAITSVGADGRAAYYAEVCAPVFAATYSGNRIKTLTSTSFSSSCSDGLRGTSFSAPSATGMIALALETNPSLTWRDIQHLIVQTSKRHNLRDEFSNWQRNGGGFYVSQVLGFGLMDAEALVHKAKTWMSVEKQISCSTPEFNVAESTNYYTPMVLSSRRIRNGESCRIYSLEHVKIKVSFSFVGKRGNIILLLESTTGTKSYLMTPRPLDSVKYPFSGSKVWDFSTVHFWGEKLEGTWKLIAKTDNVNTTRVTLRSWKITFYGLRKGIENISNKNNSSAYSTSKIAGKTTDYVFERSTKHYKNNTKGFTTSKTPDTTTNHAVSSDYSSSDYNINKNNTSGLTTSKIIDKTTVFGAKTPCNRNYTTYSTKSTIPDTAIGAGPADYNSDQKDTSGFEFWTFVVISTVSVVTVITLIIIVIIKTCRSTKPTMETLKQTRPNGRHLERY